MIEAVLLALSIVGDPAPTCAFEVSAGTEFEFAADADASAARWIENFSPHKDFSAEVDPRELAGKRAKIVRPATGLAYGRAQEVLTEDCRTLFMRDEDQRLLPSDEEALAIRYISDLPSIWSVQEKVDRMTDAKICMVTPDASMPYPMFHYSTAEGFSVGVVGADFPGREVAFRVDKNPAISNVARLSPSQGQELVRQIRAGGESLLVSGYEFPHDYPQLGEFPLHGLVAALDLCRDATR